LQAQDLEHELLCSGCQAPPLVGKSHPAAADLFPENAIFLNQIFGDVLLPLIDPTAK
jgi:hypothetical protein